MVGKEFDPSYVNKIVAGKTTKEDIRQNIGEPHSVTTTNQGETWSYQHVERGNMIDTYKWMIVGGDSKINMQSLSITFEGDKVKTYALSK